MANLSPAEKLARLQEKTRAAEEALREQKERQIIILGKACLREMDESDEFRQAVQEVLRRHVKRPGERADIASLLLGPPNGQIDFEL